MSEREGINALIDAAVIVQKLREENAQLREALRELREADDPWVQAVVNRALGDTPDEC
jgi:hypothetical protein